MKKDTNLGNVFLDVALAGAVMSTIGLGVDVLNGDVMALVLIAAAVVTYGAYIIGAIRVGASPLQYLREVGKRGSLPR